MHIMYEQDGDIVQSIKLECSPVEFLVLEKALRQFAENKENHIVDIDVAEKMFKSKPMIHEK